MSRENPSDFPSDFPFSQFPSDFPSDFLSDFFMVAFQLKTKTTKFGKILLCSLTFIPPLVFAVLYPRIFFLALEYAGAFGVILLLGALPVLMVWKGRYRKDIQSSFKVIGGRFFLIIVLLFCVCVTGIVIAEINGLFTFVTNQYFPLKR